MNNFTIRINKQTSINTPTNTSANTSTNTTETIIPNTGAYTTETNDIVVTNFVWGISIILAILAVGYFVIYWLKKKKIYSTLVKVFTITFITTFVLASVLQSNVSANNPTNPTNPSGSNTLSISVDNFLLDIEPNDAGKFGYGSSVITVNNATTNGYTLSAYTTTPDLINDSDSTQMIRGLNSSTKTILSNNTWGVATNKPIDETSAVWTSLPLDLTGALVLKDTDVATPANDTTEVYYGTKVNDELAAGDYKGTIVYTAVAKVVTASCPANAVCYDGNGASMTTSMKEQSFDSSDTKVTLWASNFKRDGYGFAGWNTKSDGMGTNYGPNQNISFSAGTYSNEGLQLYAKWVNNAGDLQDWGGCSSLSIGQVTALTDKRDNNTYAVAKLVDGRCWMIENLRFGGDTDLGDSIINTNTSNNPASDFVLSASQNPTSTSWCSSGSSSCVDKSMFYFGTVTEMDSPNDNAYSYGAYYNYYSAVAGTRKYANNAGNATGSICPKGWSLPSGEIDEGYYELTRLLSGGTFADNSGLMAYPNNFLYSGTISSSSFNDLGDYGNYWTATARTRSDVYNLFFYDGGVEPGTHTTAKSHGASIRCVAN